MERRLDAPGRAVHLFGIAAPELAGRRFTIDGRRVVALAFGRLALLVHYVDAAEWGAESIERKRADREWLSAQARLYERMLERAMSHGTVVPAGFLAVFSDLASLEGMARDNYTRWRRALTRIAGKREWCVSVYRGPHAIPPAEPYVLRVTARGTNGRIVLPRSAMGSAVAPKSAGGAGVGTGGASAAPPGAPVRSDLEQIGDHLQRLWKACGAVAAAARQIEPLPDRRYLFGGTFLLPHPGADEFREVLARLAESGKLLGLTYYLEGPRPPFTFS